MKLLLILAFLLGCQEQKEVNLNKNMDKYFAKDTHALGGQNANSLEDDFSDLKEKKDESCEDEEAIEKKLVEAKKAYKLQGQKDEDCQVE